MNNKLVDNFITFYTVDEPQIPIFRFNYNKFSNVEKQLLNEKFDIEMDKNELPKSVKLKKPLPISNNNNN